MHNFHNRQMYLQSASLCSPLVRQLSVPHVADMLSNTTYVPTYQPKYLFMGLASSMCTTQCEPPSVRTQIHRMYDTVLVCAIQYKS